MDQINNAPPRKRRLLSSFSETRPPDPVLPYTMNRIPPQNELPTMVHNKRVLTNTTSVWENKMQSKKSAPPPTQKRQLLATTQVQSQKPKTKKPSPRAVYNSYTQNTQQYQKPSPRNLMSTTTVKNSNKIQKISAANNDLKQLGNILLNSDTIHFDPENLKLHIHMTNITVKFEISDEAEKKTVEQAPSPVPAQQPSYSQIPQAETRRPVWELPVFPNLPTAPTPRELVSSTRGSFPCSRCRVCKKQENFVQWRSDITSTHNHRTYPITEKLNCKDHGIFLYECRFCKNQMLLKTKGPFHKSIVAHRDLISAYMNGKDRQNHGILMHFLECHPEVLKQEDFVKMNNLGAHGILSLMYTVTYIQTANDSKQIKKLMKDWTKRLEPQIQHIRNMNSMANLKNSKLIQRNKAGRFVKSLENSADSPGLEMIDTDSEGEDMFAPISNILNRWSRDSSPSSTPLPAGKMPKMYDAIWTPTSSGSRTPNLKLLSTEPSDNSEDEMNDLVSAPCQRCLICGFEKKVFDNSDPGGKRISYVPNNNLPKMVEITREIKSTKSKQVKCFTEKLTCKDTGIVMFECKMENCRQQSVKNASPASAGRSKSFRQYCMEMIKDFNACVDFYMNEIFWIQQEDTTKTFNKLNIDPIQVLRSALLRNTSSGSNIQKASSKLKTNQFFIHYAEFHKEEFTRYIQVKTQEKIDLTFDKCFNAIFLEKTTGVSNYYLPNSVLDPFKNWVNFIQPEIDNFIFENLNDTLCLSGGGSNQEEEIQKIMEKLRNNKFIKQKFPEDEITEHGCSHPCRQCRTCGYTVDFSKEATSAYKQTMKTVVVYATDITSKKSKEELKEEQVPDNLVTLKLEQKASCYSKVCL